MESKQEIPLSVVLEDLETYFSTFSLNDTLTYICSEALQSTWSKESNQLSDWKITDRYGRELSPYAKLRDCDIPPQDTIYMSKKIPNPKEERLFVRMEDKVL